jgi:hypothetical protein
MRITANGAERNHGTHVLLNRELTFSRKSNLLDFIHILASEDETIGISWQAKARLSGQYSFRLEMTRADVARLFVAAFADVPLADVLGALREGRATEETYQRQLRKAVRGASAG